MFYSTKWIAAEDTLYKERNTLINIFLKLYIYLNISAASTKESWMTMRR